MYLTEEDDLGWPQGHLIIFTIFFVLIFLPSCSKKNSINSNNKKSYNSKLTRNFDAESIRLKEAKYSDIPLPVGFRFVELKKESEKKSISKSNENADFICYQGNMPVEQVLDYYRANMERCGWRIDDLSCTQEGLLFCNKRSKSCVISVRDDLKKVGGTSIPKSHVYLFIKNKFQEEDKKIDINSKIVF